MGQWVRLNELNTNTDKVLMQMVLGGDAEYDGVVLRVL